MRGKGKKVRGALDKKEETNQDATRRDAQFFDEVVLAVQFCQWPCPNCRKEREIYRIDLKMLLRRFEMTSNVFSKIT
jgi:hypothetical protein